MRPVRAKLGGALLRRHDGGSAAAERANHAHRRRHHHPHRAHPVRRSQRSRTGRTPAAFPEEVAHYRQYMRVEGRYFYAHLDPVMTLGIIETDPVQRARYAGLYLEAERERVRSKPALPSSWRMCSCGVLAGNRSISRRYPQSGELAWLPGRRARAARDTG